MGTDLKSEKVECRLLDNVRALPLNFYLGVRHIKILPTIPYKMFAPQQATKGWNLGEIMIVVENFGNRLKIGKG